MRKASPECGTILISLAAKFRDAQRPRLMTERIKVGVAGVGAMGKNHARVLASLDDAQLTAIYDLDPQRADEIAAQYGAKSVTTLHELAALTDAVAVAVPTVAHRQVAGL